MLFTTRLIEFFGHEDPIEYFSLRAQSLDEVIKLDEIGFTFAVQELPPEIGRIRAFQVDWDGVSGDRVETEIPMEPCTRLGVTNLPLANDFSKARDGSRPGERYLCPNADSKMQVVGGYLSREFSYLKVTAYKCDDNDLPEGIQCAGDEFFETNHP